MLLDDLKKRSGNCCELCGSTTALSIYQVPPSKVGGVDDSILACEACISQINNPETMDSNHWRCLNDSMWSEHLPVKVMAWRMLNRLKGEGWSLDLLNMLYLTDEELSFAQALNDHLEEADKVVVLIKDLKVKGSSMVAKQGTVVRKIALDPENAQYIEGKVYGQQIVILTQYVKKTN